MDSEHPNNSEPQITFHSVFIIFLSTWTMKSSLSCVQSSSSPLVIIQFGSLLQNPAMENSSLQQQDGGRGLRYICYIVLTHTHRHMCAQSLQFPFKIIDLISTSGVSHLYITSGLEHTSVVFLVFCSFRKHHQCHWRRDTKCEEFYKQS